MDHSYLVNEMEEINLHVIRYKRAETTIVQRTVSLITHGSKVMLEIIKTHTFFHRVLQIRLALFRDEKLEIK